MRNFEPKEIIIILNACIAENKHIKTFAFMHAKLGLSELAGDTIVGKNFTWSKSQSEKEAIMIEEIKKHPEYLDDKKYAVLALKSVATQMQISFDKFVIVSKLIERI